MSAVFDTVGHQILLARLRKALAWFSSYLENRSQFIRVGSDSSNCSYFSPYGVPQESVLGTLLYLLYTAPLSDALTRHDMLYHFYADDSQIYVSFHPSCPGEPEYSKSILKTEASLYVLEAIPQTVHIFLPMAFPKDPCLVLSCTYYTLHLWVMSCKRHDMLYHFYADDSQIYRIYPCISRPFMASKEAPKIALDLYMGQRFRAKFHLNNLFKINIIMWSLGITNAVDERLQNECN